MAPPKKGIKKTKKPSKKKKAASAGPVTLDQARALATAKKPKLAMAAESKSSPRPTSPARIGAMRERVDAEWRKEINRRVREYRDTMKIMKQRGAVFSAAKGTEKKSFQPLQIIAEGDSWFDYPAPFFGGGVITRLEKSIGSPILNLSKAGDEVRFMLGVEERTLLIEHLSKGSPAGGPWDVMLFSGGGNDVVDNPMALWIKDWDANLTPAAHINQPRYDAILALVRAGYEDLIELRNSLSPDTHLVFHAYDFALPDGRGICHLGPWLKPTFDLKNFPTQRAGEEVVIAMLKQFANMLTTLAAQPKVTFMNGQGKLPAKKKSWHNELHPSRSGFNFVTGLFHQQLKSLFPNHIP